MQIQTDVEKAFLRKYPEPVVLVTTRNAEGRANAMAAGWFSVASSDPWMFMLGIDESAYTYELIKATGQFVVAYPSESMVFQVLHVGSHHGHNRDKLTECGLALQKAEKVSAPLIAGAVANFECELVDIYKPGDCPLIMGKVLLAHENADAAQKRLYTVGPHYTLGGVRSLG